MGNLYVVATPIGNLSDVTKRAIDTLKEVDIILCEDTRHSLILLNHYEIKSKLISYHKFNEAECTQKVIVDLKDGKNIAIITDAGTPCISDPGYILIKRAKEEKINVIPIGGISACITALSVSGLNSDSFTFYGFFPREEKYKKELVESIKKSDVKTYIFYESPKRIINTINYLYKEFGNIMVSISSDLTKLHERNYYGKLSDVLKEITNNEKSSLGEYTIVIEKEKAQEENVSISLEALLLDIILKNSVTIKEAINILNEKEKDVSKKEIYNASLNLKELLK